jgi:tetratricopeptide (TPR) repeat protein
MEKLIYVFYDGKTQWWLAIKRPNEKIRFDHLIQFFLGKLEQKTQEKVSLKQILVLLLDGNQRFRVDDFTRFIPYSQGSNTEIYITIEDKPPFRKRGIVYTPKVQKLIDCGKVFCEKGDFKTGIDLFSEADIYGLLETAKNLYKLKRWKFMEPLFPKLLIIFPGSVDVAIIHGSYLEHLGYFDEALDAYRRALKFTDSPEITVGLSRLFLQRGDVSYANLMIKSALLADDMNPNTLIQSAAINLKTEQYDLAVLVCLRNPKCYKYLAEISKAPQGLEAIQHAFTSMKIPEKGRVQIAWELYMRGRREESLRLLHQISVELNRSPLVSVVYLYILLVEGRTNTFFEIVQLYCEKHSSETYGGISFSEIDSVFNSLGSYSTKSMRSAYDKKSSEYSRTMHKRPLAIFIILSVFLFINGNYMESMTLRAQIAPYVSETALCPEYKTLHRLFYLCYKQPPLTGITTPAGYIYVVGDEFLLMTGSAPVLSNGMPINLRHAPIPNLSIWKLLKKNDNGLKQRFFDAIEYASKYSAVLIFLGTNDCEVEIPRHVRNYRFQSVKEAIHNTVFGFGDLIRNIKTTNPDCRIYIHPAIPRYDVTAPLVGSLNTELRARIGSYAWFVDGCISSGKCPSVFPIDSAHITKYQSLLREEISKRIEKDQ